MDFHRLLESPPGDWPPAWRGLRLPCAAVRGEDFLLRAMVPRRAAPAAVIFAGAALVPVFAAWILLPLAPFRDWRPEPLLAGLFFCIPLLVDLFRLASLRPLPAHAAVAVAGFCAALWSRNREGLFLAEIREGVHALQPVDPEALARLFGLLEAQQSVTAAVLMAGPLAALCWRAAHDLARGAGLRPWTARILGVLVAVPVVVAPFLLPRGPAEVFLSLAPCLGVFLAVMLLRRPV